MQYTSNYNLMLPEGTDAVNLLTQMNPNTNDIDAAMFANKQAVVGRATELTAGTVHAITRSNPDSPVFAFTATSNWTAGDTMSVDGSACSVYLPDGTTPDTGNYVINSEVLCIIQGSRVTIFTPGAVTAPTVAAEDVTYDNTVSGLTATDVQAAIDEVNTDLSADITNVQQYVEYNTYGTVVNISAGTPYVTTKDGYVRFNGSTTQTVLCSVNSYPVMQIPASAGGAGMVMSLFVRKGMEIAMTNGSAVFLPLE